MSDQQATLEPMFDGEGRRLGPRGVLVVLRAQLTRAQQAGDQAEIDDLRAKLAIAERAWQEWCSKTGYSIEESTEKPRDLAPIAAIAARRAALEDELRDLCQRADSARELLSRGLWRPMHHSTLHSIEKQIKQKEAAWKWTETEAQREVNAQGLRPVPQPEGWSPFQLLDEQQANEKEKEAP